MFSAHVLREKWGIPVMHEHILRWRPLPDLIKRLPACIVWLYYASSSIIWWFPDNFFFSCLVCGPLEKKKALYVTFINSNNYLLCTCAARGKGTSLYGLSVVCHWLSSAQRSWSIHVGIWVSGECNESVEIVKKHASNHLVRFMSVRKTAFCWPRLSNPPPPPPMCFLFLRT